MASKSTEVEQDGKSYKTAFTDNGRRRLYLDGDLLQLEDFAIEDTGCFELNDDSRAELARLLAQDLPPAARAELCRGLLGIADDEVPDVREQFSEWAEYLPESVRGLLAKLEGKS